MMKKNVQSKGHFKMYKAGKKWVSYGLSVMGVALVVGTPVMSATLQLTTPETVSAASVQETDFTQVPDSVLKAARTQANVDLSGNSEFSTWLADVVKNWNNWNDQQAAFNALANLGKEFAQNKQLKSVDLNGTFAAANAVDTNNGTYAAALFWAMQLSNVKTPSFETLDLSNNNFTPALTNTVYGALSINRTVKNLLFGNSSAELIATIHANGNNNYAEDGHHGFGGKFINAEVSDTEMVPNEPQPEVSQSAVVPNEPQPEVSQSAVVPNEPQPEVSQSAVVPNEPQPEVSQSAVVPNEPQPEVSQSAVVPNEPQPEVSQSAVVPNEPQPEVSQSAVVPNEPQPEVSQSAVVPNEPQPEVSQSAVVPNEPQPEVSQSAVVPNEPQPEVSQSAVVPNEPQPEVSQSAVVPNEPQPEVSQSAVVPNEPQPEVSQSAVVPNEPQPEVSQSAVVPNEPQPEVSQSAVVPNEPQPEVSQSAVVPNEPQPEVSQSAVVPNEPIEMPETGVTADDTDRAKNAMTDEAAKQNVAENATVVASIDDIAHAETPAALQQAVDRAAVAISNAVSLPETAAKGAQDKNALLVALTIMASLVTFAFVQKRK